MAKKQTKVITKKRKWTEVEVPVIKSKVEILGNNPQEVEGKVLKLDLTRQLKGKGLEANAVIKTEDNKSVAYLKSIKIMPYFIERVLRKNISYIEDSFETPSNESLLIIKPLLITRQRVSREVRKAIRNRTKNWLEDYLSQKTDEEIFQEILSKKIQKLLSINIKKTYPLSFCEIRILKIKRKLRPEEIPKKKKLDITEEKETKPKDDTSDKSQEVLDAEKEIKKAQKKASEKQEKEKKDIKEEVKELTSEKSKKVEKKKTTKKTKKKDKEEK